MPTSTSYPISKAVQSLENPRFQPSFPDPCFELQAGLDGLDKAQRKVNPSWHAWDETALGGALKPSANY